MKILSLVSFLSLGFAGVANAGEGAARRGQVSVQAAATKAVFAGPAVVKVYSGFAGASVFVADGDCATATRNGGGTTLTADRVETLTLAAGQTACVAGTSDRTIELLWKARPAAPTSPLVASR